MAGPVGGDRLSFTLMYEDINPASLDPGVSRAQVDLLTHENPRRIFETTIAY